MSVLDTRQGYWQERKKQWAGVLKDTNSGETRKDAIGYGDAIKHPIMYQRSRAERERLGISFTEWINNYATPEEREIMERDVANVGVSLFDPVLAELMCKWFTPHGGSDIFDPMAGDTRKGLVFGYCGHSFTGIELRPEQVAANNRMIDGRGLDIKYICDDGKNVLNHIAEDSQDLLFCCPPYFDLEKYSDDARDASNTESYGDFLALVTEIFGKSWRCLRDNRFAVIVISDVRRKEDTAYNPIVADFIKAFESFGGKYYNSLILVEQFAGKIIAAGRNMTHRKVTKTHQNVLVFFKGDPRKISSEFPEIDFSGIESFDEEQTDAPMDE